MANIYQAKALYEREHYNDIRQMLARTCELHGDRIAYQYRLKPKQLPVTKTYQDLQSEINQLGTGLYAKGWLKQTAVHNERTHIGVIGENSYAWVLAHNAAVLGAGISVPMDKQLAIPEVINLCQRGLVEVMFVDYKLKELALSLVQENLPLKAIVIMNSLEVAEELKQVDERFFSLEELMALGRAELAQGNDIYLRQEIDREAMSVLSFTSGTTTMAKGVMLSQRAIVEDVTMTLQTVDIKCTDKSLSVLPLHHIFESSLGMYAIWASGACVCINDGLRYIAYNLKDWQISVLLAVPLLMENIYKQIMHKVKAQGKEKSLAKAIKLTRFLRKLGIDLRRKVFKAIHEQLGGELRYNFVGASALDAQINQFFLDIGINCYMGYGLTETAPLICGCNDKCQKPGSVGNPLPGISIKIEDIESGAILEPEQPGEIVVKTPSLMNGYYQNSVATAEVMTEDGWFYTGDIGYFDKNDCLHITGRSKSMIVLTNGKKVFPEEIEYLINQITGVSQSIVFGEENNRGNIDICALLKIDVDHLPDGTTPAEFIPEVRQQIEAINEQMPVYKKVRYLIWKTGDFISTTTLKIKRQAELDKIHALLKERGKTAITADGECVD